MSIDYGTYVGPYVRCAVGTKEIQALRIACPNPECLNYACELRTPYCHLCGKQVGSVTHTVTVDAVDVWDMRETIDDALTTPSGDAYMHWAEASRAHLWIPNRAMPGRDPHLESRVDFALVAIEPGQIQAELDAFRRQFQHQILQLIAAYGVDVVTLHWGIIQDYS